MTFWLKWGTAAFVVVYVISSPPQAAHTAAVGFNGVIYVFTQFGRFMTALSRGVG